MSQFQNQFANWLALGTDGRRQQRQQRALATQIEQERLRQIQLSNREHDLRNTQLARQMAAHKLGQKKENTFGEMYRGADGEAYQPEISTNGRIVGSRRVGGQTGVNPSMATASTGGSPGGGYVAPARPQWQPKSSEMDLISYLPEDQQASIYGVSPQERTKMLVSAAKLKRSGAGQTTPRFTGVKNGVGFNPVTGQMEQVPLSPQLMQQNQREQQQFLNARHAEYESMAHEIQKAIGLIDQDQGELFSSSGGMAGKIAEYVPSLDGYELARTIDTVQANLSFDKLQAIRDASKTGGGLGSISERELQLLGSSVASLDSGLPAETKRKNLQKVLRHYQRFIESLGISPPEVLPPGVTEEDIQETMRANNMSREQVMEAIRVR